MTLPSCPTTNTAPGIFPSAIACPMIESTAPSRTGGAAVADPPEDPDAGSVEGTTAAAQAMAKAVISNRATATPRRKSSLIGNVEKVGMYRLYTTQALTLNKPK